MPHILAAGGGRRLARLAVAAGGFTLLSLHLTGCSSGALEPCVPKTPQSANSAQLAGSYEGVRDAKGAHLVLTADPEAPAENGGTLTVRNWPTGDYYRESLGDTFDGSGTWEVQPASRTVEYPMLRLHFDKPEDFMAGDTLDLLSIASDSSRTVLYDETDPDTCPAFRMERRANS